MVWSSKYLTGNKIVDDDHQEIFRLVKDVIDQKYKERKEKVTAVIAFLVEYTVRHFNSEERLMAESDYPKTDEHKKQHADFVAVVSELQGKIEQDPESLDISLEVNNTIVAWLVHHVIGSDKDLADHYRTWSKSGGFQ